MILSFKKEFPEKILSGEKIHSIRPDPGNRWKPGMKIHFATGVRTKNYEQFMAGECKSVQGIFIDALLRTVIINNKTIKGDQLIWLSAKDGFDHVDDFFEFFFQEYNGEKFTGKLIHWTDFKY